jgi:hypothetical protein
MRGRFNGLFLMITTIGTLAGSSRRPFGRYHARRPYVVAIFMVFNALAVLTIMLPNREHVKAIYNRDI